VCNPNCADFPIAAINKKIVINVIKEISKISKVIK